MEHQYNIFYSWQSDKEDIRDAISDAIEDAIDRLKKEDYIIANKDEATRGESGFVNIEDVVKQKIEHCDVFICDITPLRKLKNGKCLPNPNVVFELGYASCVLDSHCIIAVAQKGGWKAEKMPFDFNHHSMFAYDIDSDSLYGAIKDCINYSKLHLKNDYPLFFSNRQVNRNVLSSKYLPDTFVESSSIKQAARFFAASSDFYPMLFEYAKHMNFEVMNGSIAAKVLPKLKSKEYKKIFNKKGEYSLKIDQFDLTTRSYDMSFFEDVVSQLSRKLNKDVDILSSIGNSGYHGSHKMKMLSRDVDILNKRIFMVQSKAGFGKTNFLCDFVQNVLIKRDIPFVYLNAFEIGDDIAMSLSKEIYFISNKGFDDVLERISDYCRKSHRYFIIVIDGLNENANLNSFRQNLIRLLYAVMQYPHVKVMLSCRTDYYNLNYKDQFAAFDKVLHVERLDRTYDDREMFIMIERYLEHFNIQATFTPQMIESFSHERLLFRIFCEANRGENLGFIDDINHESLFGKYYEMMAKEVAIRLNREAFPNITEHDIRSLIDFIISYMIDKEIFINVDINDVKKNLPPDMRQYWDRFINESLLLQVDHGMGNETLRFTYDQFRDYCIAHYIIKNLSGINNQKVLDFIEKYVNNDRSILAEGLREFLFIDARNTKNKALDDILKQSKWYATEFVNSIWDVNKNVISDRDVEAMTRFLVSYPKQVAPLLIKRNGWQVSERPKLNILILLNYLNTLEDHELQEYLNKAWPHDLNKDSDFLTYEERKSAYRYLLNLADSLLQNIEDNKLPTDSQYIFDLLKLIKKFEKSNQEVKILIDRYEIALKKQCI